MRLRTKFILLVGLVVVFSFGVTFYRTSAFQQELVLAQASNQARMLYQQILLTRKWVADHNGLFFLKGPGADPNPFLSDPEMRGEKGEIYVKRNPAMVTRELSGYAESAGFFRYRVTTLKPINPANAPDDFEKRSLRGFEAGAQEVIEIESNPDGRFLRYMAPLLVESSCLECHAWQGYKEGDVRGGLSVSIPIGWAYKSITANNRMLMAIAGITIVVVAGALLFLIDALVVRRLSLLARAMEQYPEEVDLESLPTGRDEVGELSVKFSRLCRRLVRSQGELDKTREQVIQNEKMAAVGRLAAGVAHEINNPLSGMLNCVKAMQENPDDREQATRYMDLLGKGLGRIGHIVRQLLNFGRRDPLQLQKVQVDDLVRECFGLLELGMKNIETQLDLHLSQPVTLDGEAIKQVVVNLGINAMQAMPEGGTLSMRSRQAGGMVILEVEDTGVGMSEDQFGKIFEPFYTTKEVGEGTGLGLSVTYTLVEQMCGRITVKSEPGQGSCFRVELPVDWHQEES